MPRGRKQPHPGNPAAIASSTTKAATTTSGRSSRNSDSESDSKSDVKISQDLPSTAPTPTPRNHAQSIKNSQPKDQDSEASTEPTSKKRKTTIEMVVGYPLRIPAIPWWIPASASGYPPGDTDWGSDVPFSQKFGRVSGYPKGYPRPEGGIAGWKEILPVNKVHVPRRPEGVSSSRRGICTSPAGRKPFQSKRHVPRRLGFFR
ncbi:hypothetical protein PGT21_002429 [Puccinia graminis f. sp. tritici]|uniref:Uncharacterized protein n=1 Tax=Puccinia graminis f. sp. tritici TaxID=56615 RepID=A0A5B0N0U9_PUCGR|nr:hypothetical protein PGT21_002429 [Puccinia graminis f. sp. tritici]